MKLFKSLLLMPLVLSFLLIACEGDASHHAPKRVHELHKEDIESFSGKTVGEILASISDTVRKVMIFSEPPGYLHSARYVFDDKYSLDILIGRPQHQPAYNENQKWDTLRLKQETARESTLYHGLDILYGRRF